MKQIRLTKIWNYVFKNRVRRKRAAKLLLRRRTVRRHFPHLAQVSANRPQPYRSNFRSVTVYLVCRMEVHFKFLNQPRRQRHLFKCLVQKIQRKHPVFLSRRSAQGYARFSSDCVQVIKAVVPEHTIVGVSDELYLNDHQVNVNQIQGCYLDKRYGSAYASNPDFCELEA